MTSRRAFLGALAAAAAFALDPERALWVPGAKTISIAKPSERIQIFKFGMVFPPLVLDRDAFLLPWEPMALETFRARYPA